MITSRTTGKVSEIKKNWAQHLFAFVLIIMIIVELANITEYPILVMFVDQLSFFSRFLLLGLIVQAAISGIISCIIFTVVSLGMNDIHAMRFCKRHDSTRTFKLLFIFVFMIVENQYFYADRNGLMQLRIATETKQLTASGAHDTRILRDEILKHHGFIMIGEWGVRVYDGRYNVVPVCTYVYNPFTSKNNVEVAKWPQQIPTD